jgi:hypothetical protein
MAVPPGKTWRMTKPLLPNKSYLSSGSNRNYEMDVADGPAHRPRVGATERRSTKSCGCSLSRLVTFRAASYGRLPRPMQTGELVDQRSPGREVALC